MEPVTHLLTGACLSRTGLNRRAAYATLAMVVAAELPDIDTLWSLRGPVAGFEHHRGMTHTFLGLPFEAALVVAAIYGLHRWRVSRRRRAEAIHSKALVPQAGDDHIPVARPLTAAPVRWGLLYVFCLIALLSHLLLDYTNNYGLRPFFPFNPRWYAASITFIFDPWMFAMLLAALVLPPIFRLVGSEVASGGRRQPFAARGWAIAALAGVVGLWTLRETQHNRAIQLAMAQSVAQPSAVASGAQDIESTQDAGSAQDAGDVPAAPVPVYLQAQRALASPDPLSPFRWYTATDFGPLYQLGQADTLDSTLVPSQNNYAKLPASAALKAAESSWLGRVYLDWSPMPFVSVDSARLLDNPSLNSNLATIVSFRDPRFMGDTLLLHVSGHVPLTGRVGLDGENHVLRETMDGRVQH